MTQLKYNTYYNEKQMSTTQTVNVGERTFIPANDDFGNVARTSFLGLKDAYVITMDDGTQIGLAGDTVKTDLVPTATKKTLDNADVTVPLDVRIVGIDALTAAGVASDIQATMFDKFRKLDKATKQQYSNQWIAASAGTAQQQQDFITAMIQQLS
jgi:DNA polymerase II small subunit/DNA polymerase delta subunit B